MDNRLGSWLWSGFRLGMGGLGLGQLLLMALVLIFYAPHSVLAQTSQQVQIVVGPQETYKDIASAVRAAQPDQTIILQKGIYHERVLINKPLHLTGQDGSILDGGGMENVILVDHTQNVVISNLTLRNSAGGGIQPFAGVKVVSSEHVTVQDVIMNEVEYGVYLDSSTQCTIDHCQISGKVEEMPEDRGDGIGLWNSNNNLMTNNHVRDVRDGALFSFSHSNQVAYNQFDHLRYGLHYMYSDENTFDHNSFTDCVAGATPMYSKYITFSNNVFAHMPGELAYAILLKDMDNCVVKDNLILESNVGIQLDHSNNNQIQGNLILNCGEGLVILGNTTGNTFTGNSVRNNVVDVVSDYGALPNTWSSQGIGNYWSSYVGYDFVGTGIGAIPYQSVNYLAQALYEQPILQLFADSPGLQAIGRSLQLFPLWDFPSIEDPYPILRPPAIPAKWNPWLESAQPGLNRLYFAVLSILSTLLGLAILYKSRQRRWKGVASS